MSGQEPLCVLSRSLLERLALHESRGGRIPIEIKVAMVELNEELLRCTDRRRSTSGNGIQYRRNRRVT